MISINCSMWHDKLIDYVTSIDDIEAKLVSNQPMEVCFTTLDDESALPKIKATLKATPEFKAVYFQIHVK